MRFKRIDHDTRRDERGKPGTTGIAEERARTMRQNGIALDPHYSLTYQRLEAQANSKGNPAPEHFHHGNAASGQASRRTKRTMPRRCLFCGRWFVPDYRIGERQKCCGREKCKRARKQAANERWMKRNKEYFKGRYEYLREWRKWQRADEGTAKRGDSRRPRAYGEKAGVKGGGAVNHCTNWYGNGCEKRVAGKHRKRRKQNAGRDNRRGK